MPHLDLLVPAALVDPDLAAEILRDQRMPTLERILALTGPRRTFEPAAPPSLTTWQAWLFGERAGTAPDRVNVAELWARTRGLPPAADRGRYVVEPAHFKIANDHLRLDDPFELAIEPDEARALAAAIAPVLADAGWHLDPIDPAAPTHWFARRTGGGPLTGAAIEKAIGDNVAAWQPRAPGPAADDAAGDAALAWRRSVNEIQMLWFGHPVNEAREARGLPTINTLWLSGNGAPRAALPRYASAEAPATLPLVGAVDIDAAAPRTLEVFDGFVVPARREDWSGWRERLAGLDARLADIARRQRAGTVDDATLVFCGRDRARLVELGRRDLGRAWRGWFRTPPTLRDLFDEGSPA